MCDELSVMYDVDFTLTYHDFAAALLNDLPVSYAHQISTNCKGNNRTQATHAGKQNAGVTQPLS